jgi:hypothetical protein
MKNLMKIIPIIAVIAMQTTGASAQIKQPNPGYDCVVTDQSVEGQDTKFSNIHVNPFEDVKTIKLLDPGFTLQLSTYIGLMQVFITDVKADKEIFSAMTKEVGFTSLDVDSSTPNVRVSCRRPPQP